MNTAAETRGNHLGEVCVSVCLNEKERVCVPNMIPRAIIFYFI